MNSFSSFLSVAMFGISLVEISVKTLVNLYLVLEFERLKCVLLCIKVCHTKQIISSWWHIFYKALFKEVDQSEDKKKDILVSFKINIRTKECVGTQNPINPFSILIAEDSKSVPSF